MESTVRVEVIHHAIGVVTDAGVSTLTSPPADNQGAAQSPFVNPDRARVDVLANLIDNLSALLDLTIARLDRQKEMIKQLGDKVVEVEGRLRRHDAILRDLVLTPKTRARAQRAGIGRS